VRPEGILLVYRQLPNPKPAAPSATPMIDEATAKMAESVARRGRWLGLTK
jgi:hypothetical protein